MIIAMERIRDRELENVRFIDGDAAALTEMFRPRRGGQDIHKLLRPVAEKAATQSCA